MGISMTKIMERTRSLEWWGINSRWKEKVGEREVMGKTFLRGFAEDKERW